MLEQGCITHPETGSPQGGVISPMLANIYLHEVLDVWFEREVKPRLRGRAFLVRYADDFVMGFALEQDARRVLEVLPKRFERFGLTIHPDKTRLVEFRKPKEPRDPNGGPGTFDFLGFTPPLGQEQERELGGEAENREGPDGPGAQGHRASGCVEAATCRFASNGGRSTRSWSATSGTTG